MLTYAIPMTSWWIKGQGACEAKPKCCYSPIQPNPSNLPWCIINGGGPPPPAPTTCSGERHVGYDVTGNPPNVAAPLAGATQDECCAACTANPQCDVWIWATPGHSNGGDNCWQVKGVDHVVTSADRVTGVVHGPFPPLPPPPPPPPPQMVFSFESNASSASGTVKYYGAGGGSGSVNKLSQTSSSPHVTNTEFYIPHYWSSAGYALLAASNLPFTPSDLKSYPAGWSATAKRADSSSSSSSSSSVQWTVLGEQVDLYFMPADNHPAALSSLWDLTGRPAVVPRYALGFSACRWGWTDKGSFSLFFGVYLGGSSLLETTLMEVPPPPTPPLSLSLCVC